MGTGLKKKRGGFPEKAGGVKRNPKTGRTIDVDYVPHRGQGTVHFNPARHRVLANGRRWGKTLFGVIEIGARALQEPNGLYWWVAPTYGLAKRAWDIWPFAWPSELYESRKGEFSRTFFNGSRVEFLSAQYPERLIGAGINGVIIDEAARVPELAWYQSIRPALADKRGWSVLISTPRGKNWFHREFLRAQKEDELDSQAFNLPSYDNPYLPPEEIEVLRDNLPADTFRQEVEAEFLDDGGTVFRNVRANALSPEVITGRNYSGPFSIGIDLAKHEDYTVIVALDIPSRTVVEIDRFNVLEWPIQKGRIIEFANRYPGSSITMDSTGVGDPIYDDLNLMGLSIDGFTFTAQSKPNLVQNLMVAIEKGTIRYPADDTLLTELEAYGYDIKERTGRISYGAPSGFHDDIVMALGLAVWGTRNPISLGTAIWIE